MSTVQEPDQTPSPTELEKPSAPRRRRWAPKVRTGCLTCKIRRVKCDETKPSCQKCLSTGRKCDGYEDDAVISRLAKGHSSILVTSKHSRPHALPPSNPVYSLSWLPFYGGEQEKQTFDFFQSITSSALASFYGSEFWAQETLQVAHRYPTLFHAITAFGSIHYGYLSDATTPADVPRNGTNNCVEFGLQEYNKAIKSMSHIISQKQLSLQDQQAILTTCILFTCLSTLQGRQSQAFMHVKNGLRLIHHWQLNTSTAYSADQNAINTLLLTFMRLDTQIRPYLNGQEELLQWTHHDIVVAPSAIRPFRSVFEAYFELEVYFNKLLRLNFNEHSVKVLLLQIEFLNHQFKSWDRQFSELMSSTLNTFKESELEAVDFIRFRRVYAQCILACLELSTETNPHDDMLPEIRELLALAEKVLEKDTFTPRGGLSGDQKTRHPIFVLGSVVIEALFFAGTRCREPTLRRRALRLLYLYPRREGICEGMAAWKIVQKVIEFEEQECQRCIDWHDRNEHVTERCVSQLQPPTAPYVLPFRPWTSQISEPEPRHTTESSNVIPNHLNLTTDPTTRTATKCSPKGKWVCEAHRVVETQFLLYTERQLKVVIWTGEDCAVGRKGREMVVSWW